MKNQIIQLLIVMLFSASQGISQGKSIKDVQLDSLIWNKINEYLTSLDKTPIKHFEDNKMREFSYRVTECNSNSEQISHSDSVGWVCKYECIHKFSANGDDNSLIKKIKSKQYDIIATNIVNRWISSPPHRKGISDDEYAATTVTTIIKYNEKLGTASVTTSWHAIFDPNFWPTQSGYYFQVKNKN
jgi:hypothetical protein